MNSTAKYLSRREASAYLRDTWGVSYTAGTLSRMATTGGGPPYVIIGNKALTTTEWLDEWVAGKTMAPRSTTSEARQPVEAT